MMALKLNLGGEEHIAKWLMGVLNIDYSTARRKCVGQSKLSLEQLGAILQQSPSTLELGLEGFLNSNSIISRYSSFGNLRELNDYLRGIIKTFERAAKSKTQLKYVARDLPLFFYLSDRRMVEFKVAIWSNEINNKGVSRLNVDTYSLCQEVYRLYLHLDSVELWNRHAMNSQFYLVDWYCGLKKIDPFYRQELYGLLEQELLKYKDRAAKGKKENGGALDLLFTDFLIMNNGGLLEGEDYQVLMTALSTVSFLSFTNPRLCENFKADFNHHMAYANSVSRSSALNRERIFSNMLQDLRGRGNSFGEPLANLPF
jgi:hypothetical protein